MSWHPLERWRACCSALGIRHRTGQTGSWEACPWGWIRDLTPRSLNTLMRELLPMLFGLGGIASIPEGHDESRIRLALSTGAYRARSVEFFATVSGFGGMMSFSHHPLAKDCVAVGLVGVSPAEPVLHVVTRARWDAEKPGVITFNPDDENFPAPEWLGPGRIEDGLKRLMDVVLGYDPK